MKYKRYKSDEPISPYAPLWDFTFGYIPLPIDCDALSKTCLEKERKIKKLPYSMIEGTSKFTDGYTGLGKSSTTVRFQSYNVLKWNTRETNLLKKHLKVQVGVYNKHLGNPNPPTLYVQCWVNILRWGQKISTHLHSVHPSSYLSGHFNIQSQGTSTCYINPVNQLNDPEIFEENNRPGLLTLFPSYLPHYTTTHYAFNPRITIAMDIALKSPSPNWIEL